MRPATVPRRTWVSRHYDKSNPGVYVDEGESVIVLDETPATADSFAAALLLLPDGSTGWTEFGNLRGLE